jgi:aminoglycoside phosphotransferase family enzyme
MDTEGAGPTLIRSLMHESAYPHPADRIRVLDTHISWVILTGNFAYKIKKPVKLEFLDFSSLEQRKHFCEEELRLNRRWAPDLYLGVVPICGSFEEPVMDGQGSAIEFAVKMNEFPQSAQLDAQLNAGLLVDADMCDLAETIADLHATAPVYDQLSAEEAFAAVQRPMLKNIEHLRRYISLGESESLASWTGAQLGSLRETLIRRYNDGYVRDCHGDLNLTNLVRLSSGIVAYDCVEFSVELRNIDVISDMSFLAMDLAARGREDLAYLLINRYLERNGDYAGMSLFGLYYVYHALIRAKIAAIRSVGRDTTAGREADLEEMARYCSVAMRWTETRRPRLIVMHGFSGSGKTWLSSMLLARLPAIRVRSDIERKREFGLEETQSSGSAAGEGIYQERARRDIYTTLAAVAETVLGIGQDVIVDASFLAREDRQRFQALAQQLDADFIVVSTTAETGELRRRLQRRKQNQNDPSEADAGVLQYQFDHAIALSEAEREHTIAVATDGEVDVDAVVGRIRAWKQRR